MVLGLYGYKVNMYGSQFLGPVIPGFDTFHPGQAHLSGPPAALGLAAEPTKLCSRTSSHPIIESTPSPEGLWAWLSLMIGLAIYTANMQSTHDPLTIQFRYARKTTTIRNHIGIHTDPIPQRRKLLEPAHASVRPTVLGAPRGGARSY